MNALYDLPREVAGAADVENNPGLVDTLLFELAKEYAEKDAEEQRAAIERQLLNLGKAVKGLEADAKVLEQHMVDTQARLQANVDRVTRLKSWMQNLMQQAAIDKVKDPLVTVYLQRNPKSWEIVDEAIIPEQFKRAFITCPLSMVPPALLDLVTKIEVSKTLLQNHLEEDGEVIAGASLIDDRYHLRVR